MKWVLVALLSAVSLQAQSDTGELRLRISDPNGSGLKCSVELVSESNHVRKTLATDDSGVLIAKRLPFGIYTIDVQHAGFADLSKAVEIRSASAGELHLTMSVIPVQTSIKVTDQQTLIDPYRTGSVNEIGTDTIEDRATSLPGRSVIDLVNSQPGWLFEGNAVLHPRGSEYQTQFVVDGVPLTDNRSPGFAPELDADDVQSMSIYTAGIPAEYGRKMGGVVEVNTARDFREGIHGKFVASGGSFDTADGYGQLQFGWGKNTVSVSGDGAMTNWYLNPPVTQNFTNTATTSDFGVHYERDLTPSDRLGLSILREQARFEVPNELVQQQAGQREDRGSNEIMGIVSYQHVFTPNVLGDLRGMVRDDSETLSSNLLSTPIIAAQDRGFREGYVNGSLSVHHGNQEWKAGVEGDFTSLHEAFNYIITDPSQFDPGTPLTFNFYGTGLDLEQSAYVQDLIRLDKWTISAGLRWDHYQLLVNQNAVSPRIGVSRYFSAAQLLVHASYDRVFQTPAFENILLSSSPEVISLNPQVLRLPVEPSHGDYYELGLTKGFFQKLRLDVNAYCRNVDNFADDDLLLNTGVSFPIAFRAARIYGAEGKIDIPRWGRWTGFISYSYMVGSAYLPVTGGLFLGDEAVDAISQTGGRFWVSQDQRNTVRTRFQYNISSRVWAAAGATYGSGLPVEFTGTLEQALAQYGPAIVRRVNFADGRVKPSFSLDASLGAQLYQGDKLSMRLQGDVMNITNRLNLINFAGLYSGNSVAPSRSFSLRFEASF